MLLKFVVVLLCLSPVTAVNVLDQLVHENSAKGMVAVSTGPANGNSYNCDVPHLNAIQYGFNSALNISTDLTWKHSDTLFNLIGNKLGESIESYIYVCQQRKNFYNGMGATYTDCVNSLFLLSQIDPATNFTQALLYNSIWNELDFMCNGGMEIGIQSYNDLKAVYSTDAYTQCVATYYANTANNFADYCDHVSTFAVCVQEAYISIAKIRQNGWWLCERVRQGFAQGCPNVRCYILTQ